MNRSLRIGALVLMVACQKSATNTTQPESHASAAASAPTAIRTNVERTSATCEKRAACESDCTAGKPGACAKLGRLLGVVGTDAATAKRAVDLAQASCTSGDASACDQLAGYLESAVVVKQDHTRAMALWAEAAKAFRSACDHGDHEACRAAEDIYRKEHGAARDEAMIASLHQKAVKIYLTACPAGDLDACEELASEYRSESAAPGDDAKAEALTKKLCDAGRADACMTLARALPDGKPRNALEQQASSIRRRLCVDEKLGAECFILGLELDGMTLMPAYRKPVAALEMLRAGCDLRVPAACLHASANLTRRGKADEAAAFRTRYLEMIGAVCDLPIPVECANLASDYKTGDLLPKDLAQAKSFYRKACDAGLGDACARADAL